MSYPTFLANCVEDLVHATTILSSDNYETREEESDLVVADSEEDIVHASTATRGNGSSQVIRQSSRIKSKGSSSHNMRTRNAKFKEVAEIEAANVIAIGSALGLDFSEVG
ncbi:hypothetical protein Q3G72_019428 [Acer saccharum]|nr:hypothetical protein Q3G72_019428 [Acer saccharum]